LVGPTVRRRSSRARPAGRGASGLPLLAAVLATRGFVREPALAIERLLTRGEQELITAIHAGDALVLSARHDSDQPPETETQGYGEDGVSRTRTPRPCAKARATPFTRRTGDAGTNSDELGQRSLESPLDGRPTGDELRPRVSGRAPCRVNGRTDSGAALHAWIAARRDASDDGPCPPCANTDLFVEDGSPPQPPAQRVQDVRHRGHVEQVVVEHGHEPPRVAVAHVLVEETRHLLARHVADAAAAAHAPLERGEPAVGQLLAPLPA